MDEHYHLEDSKYIYGVHCGNNSCYSCATQKGNCTELTKADKVIDDEIKEEYEHHEHMEKMVNNPLWKSYLKKYFGL